MKFTRFIGTSNRNPLYRAALRSGAVRKMDLRPTAGNITLDFVLDGQPFALPMAPVVRDLVDLAAMVYVADELFLCGTGAEVTPVRSVDRRAVGDGRIGPLTKRLFEHFEAVVRGRVPARVEWLTPVW